jgi:CPA1 family monovalent cation:H+ antiporter
MVIDSAIGEIAIKENLKQFLLALSVALSVATLPQIFSWFRHIPYTLLLVLVGLILALVDIRLVNLSPGLILLIFLPPLLFEAAWNFKWADLKRDLVPICWYAVIGVVISIAGVAVGLNQLAGIPLTTALLIGGCLSATDPISVIALFRDMGTSKRLRTLMEGESLLNDGMAVVAFGFLITLALGTAEWGLKPILVQFITVIGVGISVGALFGFGISYLTQRFDLPLVEQSLTLVSAYATYLVTETLGGSGVMGVVTTGLILGNFGSRIGMNPRTRLIVTEFWDFLAFLINSIVFLLIGNQIHFQILGENLGIIALTIGAINLTRAVAIYGLGLLCNRLANSGITLTEQTVLWWGGLRGSVSIALALSIPASLLQRERIIATVFGAVLFTLLIQGLTIKPLLEKLNLLGNNLLRQKYSAVIARQVALNRVLQSLKEVDKHPGVEPEFYRCQEALIQGEFTRLQTEIDQLQNQYPNLRNFMEEHLREELLAIEANTYAEFVRAGWLNQELSPLLQQINSDNFG